MTLRHFITTQDFSRAEIDALLEQAAAFKRSPRGQQLAGKSIALMFFNPSMRTRTSFELGAFHLGGHAIVLSPGKDAWPIEFDVGSVMDGDTEEHIAEVARVLSRYVDLIAVRAFPKFQDWAVDRQDTVIKAFAQYATVPVINMLTAGHHPCQALADLMTLREAFGELEGLTVAYVGDGNNVARSLAVLGALAGVTVRVAAPDGYQLEPVAGAVLTDDPRAAADGADAVYTDVWVSMSDDPETAAQRREALASYRLDDALLDAAAPTAIALHCLPAHPGEEITAEVLYGRRQRIWDQAENRRHAQKALLELLVTPA